MTARNALLDDLSRPGSHLLVLIAVGGPAALADALLEDPDADPAGRISRALAASAAELGGSSYDVGGLIFAFRGRGAMQAGTVVAAARAALREAPGSLSDCSVYGEAHLPLEAACASDAVRLAASRMRERRSWQDRVAGRQARGVLLRVLEERGIAGNIDRATVAANAVAVGRRLGLGMRELDDLIRAAELQDLGKITVPDEILNKRGSLGPDEWAVVRRHPLVGERILAGAPVLGNVARLVGCASERWDGSGYPNGLAGEDIPLGSRILAVCVAFSAMTAERPYRAPMSPEEAVTQLRVASGTAFDPVVVDTFCLETEATLAVPVLL